MSRISVFIFLFLFFTGNIFSQDIYEAVANGDLVMVKEILVENPELLNAKNAGELTPLNLACERGQAGIVDFLLNQGADPYLGDRENSQPIHLAAISGSIECMDLLLGRGVDIDLQDDFGMTPLLFALSRGQRDMSAYIVEKGADIDLRSGVGWSAVHLAIVTRNNELAKELINRGVEVNVALETGMTPLHSAVSYGNTDLVKMLIDHGADMEAESNHGDRALNMALNPNTYDALRYLVKSGADVNHRNNRGAHLLHNIAGRGTAMENAGLLLDRGVDVNVRDDFGRTPLFFTTWSEDPDGMSKFLILNGADVNPDNCKDEKTCECYPNFSTPLHGAARHGQLALTRNLVMNGARVNIYNDEGQTPLHCAIQSGDPEIVQYLVDHGAFLNVPEKSQGSTELHLSVAMGYSDITDILLENGADPDVADNCGKTAFDYAMYYNHKALGYDLLAAGADDVKLADYLSAGDELAENVAAGEAKVWFLGHSGWAVKTQNHFLIFDYFCNTRDRKPDDSCLASGCIIPEQIKDMNVTVFITHSHGDHYDPRVFNWKETIPDIEYVLCWNQETEGNEYTLIPVHDEQQVEDMNVYVHHSTDLGGGYLIEVDGLTILHMGDHANGEDELMAEFTDEIDIIKDKGLDIDIMFGGIRGCSLGEPDTAKHAGSHSFAYKEFVETAKADGYDTDMKYMIHKGDRFKYVKEKEEEMTAL